MSARVAPHVVVAAESTLDDIGLMMSASTSPAPIKDPLLDEEVETDLPWDVIVWDDPVNLMSYVVYVLRKVFGFPEPMARKLMLEVHKNGKALVASEPREKALEYVEKLHGHGLQATMERPS